MDFSKLHGRPKKYLIGKDLPADEQVEIELYPLPIDDLHLADFSEKLSADDQVKKVAKLIALMMRCSPEDVGKFDAGLFEEISGAAMQRLNVSNDKQERVKKILEERKAKEANGQAQ